MCWKRIAREDPSILRTIENHVNLPSIRTGKSYPRELEVVIRAKTREVRSFVAWHLQAHILH